MKAFREPQAVVLRLHHGVFAVLDFVFFSGSGLLATEAVFEGGPCSPPLTKIKASWPEGPGKRWVEGKVASWAVNGSIPSEEPPQTNGL